MIEPLPPMTPKERRRFRFAFLLWAGASGYVWVGYPEIMAWALGVFMVVSLALLAVTAIKAQLEKRREHHNETHAERTRRLVNGHDGEPHRWARR